MLGTLREWGATDLVTAVMPPRDEAQRIAALGTAADYYLPFGVTWVQDAWVEPQDVATYVEAARQGALRMRFNSPCTPTRGISTPSWRSMPNHGAPSTRWDRRSSPRTR